LCLKHVKNIETYLKISNFTESREPIKAGLTLERLTLLEGEGKVGYRHGEKGAELETMDYLEFIARVTSHIPDKGQVTVRCDGLYANAHRGKESLAAARCASSLSSRNTPSWTGSSTT
jgi:hypothetical protein